MSMDATFAFNLCDHGSFGFADKRFDVVHFVFYASLLVGVPILLHCSPLLCLFEKVTFITRTEKEKKM